MDSRKGFRLALVVTAFLSGGLAMLVFLRQGNLASEKNSPDLTETQITTVQSSNVSGKQTIPRPEPFPQEITLLPVAEESFELNRADRTPLEDLQVLAAVLEGYRRAVKENPSGENREIVSALMGRNPRGVAVIPTHHPALGTDGQLLDRWGTPYFFHSVSSQATEIISAGPDRKLWTRDDLVLK